MIINARTTVFIIISNSRRASLNKAERRAEHNAIERARRECLNSKFQQLAEVLPNLKNHRRPSKGQIVEKALDWVKINMTKEDRYQYQIIQLQNENKRLMSQINFTHEANSNSGVVTPPITSTSPSVPPPPFPTTFRHQRLSSDTASISNEQNNHNNNIELNILYNNQPKEISLMCPIVPLGIDWQNQSALNSSYDHNLMPSASSSSSSKFLRDDDNESNSSNEELQKHHIQMSFQDMSQCPGKIKTFFYLLYCFVTNTYFFFIVFEMGQTVSIPPWSKIQQHIPHPTSYRLSYVPSTNPGENLNYNNHSNSYLS